MIEALHISQVATFGNSVEEMTALSQINFVFGSNATGKTTISRIIADDSHFPTCSVKWKSGTRLQTMVYNQDFVDRNFNQSTDLKGVFTLGEKNVDTLNKIAASKVELDALTATIEGLTASLQGDDGASGKKGELATLESNFKDTCWTHKQKHDAKFSGAFEGFRGSAEKFKAKVLQETSANPATVVTLAELERKAETIFGPTPVAEQRITPIEPSSLSDHEANPVLTKRVIGRDDVDIAAMIKKLGNSDWVQVGRSYYDANGKVCPFCQQGTSDAFAQSLKEYFDESFLADSKAIEDLASNYSTDATRLQHTMAAIIGSASRFLNVEKLKLEKDLFDSRVAANIQKLATKKKEPSQIVALESVGNVLNTIRALIDEANAQIDAHNTTVANLSQERRTLTSQVWKYLLEQELKNDLTAYIAARDGLEKAIKSMTDQIANAGKDKSAKAAEIRALEKTTTSIQPTIDAINAILKSFGFQGFAIAKATSSNSYRLVRANGTDAKATLSEGEKNFVTFLYFYHLLKGSDSDSGITTDRSVVFDDPVSSLDSDILFIVSSLIKGLFDEVRTNTGNLKQIFVLTHNVYFHKEITFNSKRPSKGALKEETFWVVRRPGLESKVVRHPTNPIKTSYELLWAEVRKPDQSHLTIQNTLRRILESYFKILGGMDNDKLCAMFEGRDRLICKSLLSWVNDGSHSVHDDLYITIDDATVDSYLKVFRAVFEKSDHLAHYRMMMGDAFAEVQKPDLTDKKIA
jgi:wobble nucleotide-excising tRNase